MSEIDKLVQALLAANAEFDFLCQKRTFDITDRERWLALSNVMQSAVAAHESARAQPASEVRGKTLALFTANQAQALLDAFGGSATTYALIECAADECAPQDDGKPSPAGLYIFDINCPEEGVIYLGDEDEESEPRAQPASVPPERDESNPAERQGLFRKFDVRRTDASDAPGGKHHGCRYFVLDVDHDAYAAPALAAYANACESTHPRLAADLRAKWGAAQPASVAKPVAWLIRSKSPALRDASPLVVFNRDDLGHYEGRKEEIVPLYTAPQPPSAMAQDAARYRFLRDSQQELVDVYFANAKIPTGWNCWDAWKDKDACVDHYMQRNAAMAQESGDAK